MHLKLMTGQIKLFEIQISVDFSRTAVFSIQTLVSIPQRIKILNHLHCQQPDMVVLCEEWLNSEVDKNVITNPC